MPLKDREARKAYHREYMRNRFQADPAFKARQLDRISRNSEKYKQESDAEIKMFRSAGCALCGETEPVCLSAHHVDQNAKDFNIGDAAKKGMSPAKVREELQKCVCLCHNCHSKVHAGLAKIPPPARKEPPKPSLFPNICVV